MRIVGSEMLRGGDERRPMSRPTVVGPGEGTTIEGPVG
jgi:hypothetical protein